VHQLQNLRHPLRRPYVGPFTIEDRRLLRRDLDQDQRDGPEPGEEEGPAGAAAGVGGEEGGRNQQKNSGDPERPDADVPVGSEVAADHFPEQAQLPDL